MSCNVVQCDVMSCNGTNVIMLSTRPLHLLEARVQHPREFVEHPSGKMTQSW